MWKLEKVSEKEINVRHNDSIVETWYREPVPSYGLMWCRYPAGHADYTGFQADPPTLPPPSHRPTA